MANLNQFLTLDQLAYVFEQNPLAITLVDASAEGQPLVHVNQAFEDLSGYRRSELLGHGYHLLFDEPDSAQPIQSLLQNPKQASSHPLTLRGTTRAGDTFLTELTLIPIYGAAHQLKYYAGFHRDVTEQQRLSESLTETSQTLQTVIRTMSEGVVVQDASGHIMNANPAAERILNLNLNELQIKTEVEASWDTIYEDGSPYPQSDHPSAKVLQNGQPIYGQVMGVKNQAGDLTWLRINSLPFPEAPTTPSQAAVVSTFVDITYLRETEQSLRKANSELLQKVETLNILSSSFEQAQRIASLGHWILELPNQKLIWSDEVYRIFGVTPQSFEATYDAFMQYVHPDDRAALTNAYNQSIEEKRNYQIKHRIIREDGSEGFVLERGFHYYDEHDQIIRSVGTVADITEQHRKDFEIASFMQLVNRQVIMSRTDLTGKITEVSDFFCQISGYRREELIGQNQNLVRHPDMPKAMFKTLWQTIQSGQTWTGEIKNLRKDGTHYWVESRISPDFDHFGNQIGYISLRLDITAQKSLEDIAIRDEMTGLYNRRFYNQSLHKTILKAKEQNQWLCFVMIDADHFKKYNDTYGHQAGDEVLREIARTMKSVLNEPDSLCFRLGGEEFAALFVVNGPEQGKARAQALCDTLYDKHIEHTGNPPWMRVTLSIGVLLMNPDQTYIEDELYKYADMALYQAKEAGRNRIQVVKDQQEIVLF